MLPRISYSQNGEDILLDRFFQGRKGSFLDIGAYHPVIDNNTFFFYERGWRGVNIEPLAANIEIFRNLRPEDTNIHCALSDNTSDIFYVVAEAPGLSTLCPDVAELHRKAGFTVHDKTCPVLTFQMIIEQYPNITSPNIVSIDVEGNEKAVVLTFPFHLWQPEVFIIESTVPLTTINNQHKWEGYLKSHEYSCVNFNGLNRIYLRNDLLSTSRSFFETPVNYLDDFKRAPEVKLEQRILELEQSLRNIMRFCSTTLCNNGGEDVI